MIPKSETAATVESLLAELARVAVDATAPGAARLRRLIGGLAARVNTAVSDPDGFVADIEACFSAATGAGATFDALDRVRVATMRVQPDSKPARAVVNLFVHQSLAKMARITSFEALASDADIRARQTALIRAFDAAEEMAADTSRPETYRALVALRGSVVRDLASRFISAPRLIKYDVGRTMSALALAQRLYGDPTRADELRRLNKVVHGAFMPASGVALSE